MNSDGQDSVAGQGWSPGNVDKLTATVAAGWAIDPMSRKPSQVRVLLDDVVIASGRAGIDRPDITAATGLPGPHGFQLFFESALAARDVARLQVQCSIGDEWLGLRIHPGNRKGSRVYQDFDGTGASRSREKLQALKLYNLPARHSRAEPLKGKSVLDIGCNEGFFCIEAVRQGASRVVGIDKTGASVESARIRCPQATFHHGSWWDVPDEKFDVILFLSAIHYEPRQRKLLAKLREHLTPDGVLVLECGVFPDPSSTSWRVVRRGDGDKRYPTGPLLIKHLLDGYAVRPIGPSIDQKGDPVKRFVYHCSPYKAVAMIIAGRSLTGKSSLSSRMEDRRIPSYLTDKLINRLLKPLSRHQTELSKQLIAEFGAEGRPNLAHAGKFIVARGLAAEFCELIAQEIPVEAELLCIEGEVLRHPALQDILKNKLVERGIRPWLLTPL